MNGVRLKSISFGEVEQFKPSIVTGKLSIPLTVCETATIEPEPPPAVHSILSKIPSLSSSSSQLLLIPSPSESFAVGVPAVAPSVQGSIIAQAEVSPASVTAALVPKL